jgi:hypothetical protein
MMCNQGGLHKRKVVSVLDELGNVGGLMELALRAGFVLFFFTKKPFIDLNLALKFKLMKDQILQQQSLLNENEQLDRKYEVQLGCCFHIYWYLR